MTLQKFFSNRLLAAGSIIAAAGLAFLPVLRAGYVQWDDTLLTSNLALRSLSIEQLGNILRPSGGAYQPVRDLYFSLIYSFSGFDPFGYHLANWLLYLVVVVLAFFAARALVARCGFTGRAGGNVLPWLTALFFSVHPLHTEAVAWMQGNKDLLATAFFLSAFICWEKYTRRSGGGIGLYLGSLSLFLLALGSKPSAVAFPLVVLALDLLLPSGRETGKQSLSARLTAMLPRYLPLLLPAAVLSFYFVFVSGALDTSRLSVENLLALPLILADYYRLILLPVGLSHRYIDPAFNSLVDPAWWAGLLITTALITLAWRARKTQSLAAFGIAWFYLCWLPQSNIFPLEIRVADRYVFISLFGVVLAAAAWLLPLLENKRTGRPTIAVGTLLAIVLGILSWQRSSVWQDGVSLWSDSVAQYPQSSFHQYGLAEAWLSRDNLDSARVCYQRAAELSPGEARNWASLAYTWKQAGNLELAEKYYLRALELDSLSYFASNSLGNIYSQTSRDSLALGYYRRALSLKPGDYMAIYNLAGLYRKLGDNVGADNLLGTLESSGLPQPVVLLRRGRDFIEQGKLDSARVRFRRAVELDDNLMVAWAGLGEVYLRQDSTERALKILRRVVDASEPGWTLLNNMALAFERLEQPDSALAYYRMAFRAQPDSVQSAVNLAVLLNRRGARSEAIAILEQVLERHPENFPALRNLGNWLTMEERYEDAAARYRRALEVNPGDANTHYNLGRLCLQFLNRPADGLHHLKECLRLDPNMPQAELVRGAIAQLEAVN